MDTSETYKLMAQQAEREAPELFYKSTYDIQDYTFKVEGNDLLWWLPRQDQLQEMIGIAFDDVLLLFFEWYLEHPEVKTTALIAGEKIFSIEYLYSMEQLWLAFVMKEKYQKRWDGSNWTTAPQYAEVI